MRKTWVVAGTLYILLSPNIILHAATLAVPGAFPNIQSAINAASNGDVILVAPGLYTQNLNYLNKAIAIRSVSGPASTMIDVNGGTAVVMGSNAELTGFTVSGGNAVSGAGIEVSGTSQLIKGNIFQNNVATTGGYGAAIGGNFASPLVEGNVFRNNSGDDQFPSCAVTFVNASSPVIVNNLFYNNSAGAINLTLIAGSKPSVINNTVVGNTTGISVFNIGNAIAGDADDDVFQNNIIAENTIGLDVQAGNPPIWQNNLLFNNATEYGGIPDPTGTKGNLIGDPLFVGPADFHLMSGSAALGVGSSLLAPATDFDGNPRPPASIDIGAYQSSVPEPSTLLCLIVFVAGCLGVRRSPIERASGDLVLIDRRHSLKKKSPLFSP